MPVSSFWEYNQYHCSTSLAPSTPWLTSHAATGIVLLLPFLSRHSLEASLLLNFGGNNIPTSLVCTTLFPTFSITFHDAPFSPQTRTTPTLSMVYLLLPPETCCNIAGTLLHHHRRKLPETEGFSTASIVTPKQGLLRNADRALYETYFFSFLMTQVPCFLT